MDQIFVDTSAFISLNNPNDSNYQRAINFVNHLKDTKPTFVTSNYVIAESLTIISQKISHKKAIDFYRELGDINIIQVSSEIDETGFKIFKKLTSKNVSFIDCTSFALMNELNLKFAFSFDKHFQKQGFQIPK